MKEGGFRRLHTDDSIYIFTLTKTEAKRMKTDYWLLLHLRLRCLGEGLIVKEQDRNLEAANRTVVYPDRSGRSLSNLIDLYVKE